MIGFVGSGFHARPQYRAGYSKYEALLIMMVGHGNPTLRRITCTEKYQASVIFSVQVIV